MKNFFNTATGKLVFIGILVLLLLIPAGLISSLVSERQTRQEEAITEVSSKWSGSQIVAGPILKVPYNVHWKEKIYDKDGQFLREEPRVRTEHFFSLPEELKVTGNVNPETRLRGIYEVVLYRSKLKFSGTFSPIDLVKNNLEKYEILWDKAIISVGISDMRGIEENPVFIWNEKTIDFEPETKNDFIPVGIHAQVSGVSENMSTIPFQFDLSLKGSRTISFLPLGKDTVVDLDSPWIAPSFEGNFLPTKYDITEKGFTSNWTIPYLERNFPQNWHSDDENLNVKIQMDESAFGVKLIIPVDFYQKNERSVKYAVLFVLLTFVTFFLFEILQKLRIHPFQYLLVGIAMCVFYLLLLSLSEHLSFALAYLVASVATIGLISVYCFAVLKTQKNALIIGGLLTVIYVYLYILLQLQDYALLLGAIFIFVILALIMFVTRKIDWYSIRFEKENNANKD